MKRTHTVHSKSVGPCNITGSVKESWLSMLMVHHCNEGVLCEVPGNSSYG